MLVHGVSVAPVLPTSMPFPTRFLQLKVSQGETCPKVHPNFFYLFSLLSLSNFYSSFLIFLFFLLQGDKVEATLNLMGIVWDVWATITQ